jgi:hypothetical protein
MLHVINKTNKTYINTSNILTPTSSLTMAPKRQDTTTPKPMKKQKVIDSDDEMEVDTAVVLPMQKLIISTTRNLYLESDTTNVNLALYDENNRTTLKNVTFTLQTWRELCTHLDEATQALQGIKANKQVELIHHLGGAWYVTLKTPFWCVHIREYDFSWDSNKIFPTHNGIAMKHSEWDLFVRAVRPINEPLNLSGIVPCYLQSDHCNQEGAMTCMECQPFYYQEQAAQYLKDQM